MPWISTITAVGPEARAKISTAAAIAREAGEHLLAMGARCERAVAEELGDVASEAGDLAGRREPALWLLLDPPADPLASLPAYKALMAQIRKDAGGTGDGPSTATISPVARQVSEKLLSRLAISGGASAASAAVGGVAGYYRDVDEMRARDPSGFQAKIDAGIAARRHYEQTNEVLVIPAVALTGDAAMTLPETFDYYGTPRAAVPNYKNEFAVMSREHFLPFDVQPAAARLTVPLLMVHSERALSPHWARKFFAAVTAQKEILWIASKGQVDFYDDRKLVADACDLLAAHFRRHLA